MALQPSVRSGFARGHFVPAGDLEVRRLGFGAIRITGDGTPREPDESHRVLRRAVEPGVNPIDAADSYGPEVSGRLIAEALYQYPERVHHDLYSPSSV